MSVQRQTHDNLGRICPQSDVVVEGVIGVEIGDVGFGVVVKWSDVTRFLVPMAVIIVRHHADPIQVARDGRNVVGGIDDGLGWRNGGRKEPTSRIESSSEFAYPSRESGLV